MLAKKFRFHGHSSLRITYTRGSQVRRKQLSLKYYKNSRQINSRCAVVVSKKVSKKAPLRNRIRRRLYETIRLRWSLIKPGYDIIITVFDEGLADMSSQQLNQLIDSLLKQANIYK